MDIGICNGSLAEVLTGVLGYRHSLSAIKTYFSRNPALYMQYYQGRNRSLWDSMTYLSLPRISILVLCTNSKLQRWHLGQPELTKFFLDFRCYIPVYS
jgi:hypothetical protein